MTGEIIWRVLPWRTDDAYTNMAIDKAIAESVAAGGSPTIRFYKWAGNGAVSFGAAQAMTDFDTAFCERERIQYVRRFTGGRVMYHGSEDLTYAIAVPLSLYPSRLELTSDTSRWIMSFLESLGIPDVRYTGNSSILTQMKKISGSAPHYEKKKAVFQHGSVFCAADYALLAELFQLPEHNIRERITTVYEQLEDLQENRKALLLVFQQAFLKNITHELGDLTEKEWTRVAELQKYYASQEWLHRSTTSLPGKICTIQWGYYPELREKLPPDLQARLINKASE